MWVCIYFYHLVTLISKTDCYIRYFLASLYSHIREHTGQLYTCSKCAFATPNKTHLLEHEDTHSNVKSTCRFCKKKYSTRKSLVNHIRRYHANKDGRSYLAEFMVWTIVPSGIIIFCTECIFNRCTDREHRMRRCCCTSVTCVGENSRNEQTATAILGVTTFETTTTRSSHVDSATSQLTDEKSCKLITTNINLCRF